MLVTPDNFYEVMESIEHCKKVFCDCETSGLEIYTVDRVIGIAIEVELKPGKFQSYYFTFGHAERYVTVDGETYLGPEDHKSVKGKEFVRHYEPNLSYEEHMPILVEYMYTRKNYWWNASFDLPALHREVGYVPDTAYDVMLLSHLSDENATELCEKLGRFKPSFKLKEQGQLEDANAAEAEAELKQKMKKNSMAAHPAKDVAEYAEQDATLTRKLFVRYLKKAMAQQLFSLWTRVCKYMRVLIRMSVRGIKVLPDVVELNEQECEEKIEDILMQLCELVGSADFNPNSPKQVIEAIGYISSARDVLQHFVDHGWNWLTVPVKDDNGEPVVDKLTGATKTRQIKYRPDEKQMKIIDLMLHYRAWSKMLTTYYRPYKIKKDFNDVIHPSFSLHGTVSGRLSSSNPNLQQVPRQSDKAKVKDVFIPRPGYAFVECDYKAAELVVGAYIAGDDDMLTVLRDGGDLHAETAGKLGVSRTKAKNVTFGTIYGLGARGLAKQLDLPEKEAQKILNGYHKLRPKFKILYGDSQRVAKNKGQIVMWTGRVRHYDQYAPTHKAISHLIQGSTAEVMRVALTKLGEEMPKLGAYPLITVHDSVLFEVPLKNYNGTMEPDHLVLSEIKNIMEFRHWCPDADGAKEMKPLVPFKGDHNFFVPMRIDMKWGLTWGNMPYEVEGWIESPDHDEVYLGRQAEVWA